MDLEGNGQYKASPYGASLKVDNTKPVRLIEALPVTRLPARALAFSFFSGHLLRIFRGCSSYWLLLLFVTSSWLTGH